MFNFFKKKRDDPSTRQKVDLKSFKHLFAVAILALFVLFIIFDNFSRDEVKVDDRKLTIKEVENYKSNVTQLQILKVKQKSKKLGIEEIHEKFKKGSILDYSTIMLDESSQFALANSEKKLILPSGTVLIKVHSNSEKQYYIYRKKIVLVKIEKDKK